MTCEGANAAADRPGGHPRIVTLRLPLLIAASFILLAGATAARATSPYTIREALNEWHDLSLLQRPADPPRRLAQLSSWDRNLANYDQGNFLRRDGDQAVLMDVRGPGVLTRLWTAEPMGILDFYWDGATVPQFSIPWKELQENKSPPLAEPFVTSVGGGCTLLFPLPFEKGLKIVLREQTWCHWQVNYLYFPAGTSVRSWYPAMGLPRHATAVYTAAEAAWNKPAEAPVPGDVTTRRDVALSRGTEPVLASYQEPVLVTEVQFEQRGGRVIPGGLEFVHRDSTGQQTRVPWGALCGVWDADGDSASLLHGRAGITSYFRIPFVLMPGDELGFHWNPSADLQLEALGRFMLRTVPLTTHDPSPRLIAQRSLQRVGEGTRYTADPIEVSGRLLAVSARVRSTINAGYMEGDELISLEGEPFASIRGTGFEDLFDSAWYFEKGTFATAVAASPLQENKLHDSAARKTWWPSGIPFAKSLRFELEGGGLDDAPATDEDILLIGQIFGEPIDVAPPVSTRTDPVDRLYGARTTTSDPDVAGLPVYVEAGEPISALLEPREAWLDREDTLSGTFRVSVAAAGLSKLSVHLDLPFGWRGTLSDGSASREVFDIGWPPIESSDPPPGDRVYTWQAIPPASMAGGEVIVQLRAEAELPGGGLHTVRHPVRIHAAPRLAPEIAWTPEQMTRDDAGVYTLDLPDDFKAAPGDIVVVDARVDIEDSWREAFAVMRWEPVGEPNDADVLFSEIKDLVPPDGMVKGRALLHGKRHSLVFRPGDFISWLGAPRRFTVALQDFPSARMTIIGVNLSRRPAPPATEGWNRRISYLEMPPGVFHIPRGAVSLFGAELIERLHLVVATPQDQVGPEQRPAEFLENVEAGRMIWRIADPAPRADSLNASPSFIIPFRRTGERIEIRDERFIGKRTFGFQFGYDPWSGVVGIRDCEGRLVATQNLYMNKPATFPQMLWVSLPVPSRDGWLYLEAMGTAPGGFEQRISLQRVMVFSDEDQKALVRGAR